MIGPPKPPINVQDGFFYQLRKDNTVVEVMLLSGRTRVGRIRRFDKYAVVVEVDGREEMIYKHAIALGRLDRDERPVRASARPDPRGLTRRLAFALAVLVGATAGCATAPPPEDPVIVRARSTAARAEAAASEGRLRDALDGYRDAARLAPAETRYAVRERELEDALVARRAGEADEALKRKDVAAARRAALSILEVDPNAAAGYRSLAKAAEAEGSLEDAWAAARRAHDCDPADPVLTEFVARLATKTGRWAEAESLYAALGRIDPSFREKAAAAGIEFRVQNLPRDGPAGGPFAARDARAARGAPRRALAGGARRGRSARGRRRRGRRGPARARGARPDDRARVLPGLARLAPRRRGRARLARRDGDSSQETRRAARVGELPCGASLAECGILPEGPRQVSGREAVAAIEATLRTARPGGS